MKKVVLLPLSALMAFTLVPGALAQTGTPTKVGIINIQQAILGTKSGQKAASELQQRFAPKTKVLEGKQAEINLIKEQYQKTLNTLSEDKKASTVRDIEAKTKAFNRDVQDFEEENQQEQGKVLNELGGQMLQVIDKYARDNGYSLILDVSSQQTPVLFAASGIDVTADIVALFDKNAPGAAGATSTTAPRPATGTPLAAPRTMAPGTPRATTPATTPRPTAPGTPK